MYTEQPPEYEQGSAGTACKLHKTIYGLKQAPRAWHKKLTAALESLGFQQSAADPCLFISRQDSSLLVLITYMDDVLIATRSLAAVAEVKRQLLSRFDARDLGEATSFLGMTISRDRASRTIKLLKNHVYSERTKHIDVAYNFARKRVAAGDAIFSYVRSEQMVADALTKVVPLGKFSFFFFCKGGR